MQVSSSERDHEEPDTTHGPECGSFFPGASGFHISGGDFRIHHYQRGAESADKAARAMERLSSRAERGAPYDAAAREDVPKCFESTRLTILANIRTWAYAKSLDARPFMWMYGPAGSGKTTILQTIAETFDHESSLAASFFFSRLSPDRPKVKKNFVVTIAHQLSTHIPHLRQHIGDALEDDTLFDKSLVKQMDALVIRPLNQLGFTEINGRYIVVVDGLDECEGEDAQKDVLDVLQRFAEQVGHPFRILIASRSYSHIQGHFARRLIAERTQTIPLDNDYQAYTDIEAFVLAQFNRIKEEHPSRHWLTSDWPNSTAVDLIVTRSSGQFIYAVIVMKFIAEHDRHPADSLEIILNVQIGGDLTPYKELDAVYTQVMSTINVNDNLHHVMDVLGLHILNYDFRMACIAQASPSDRIDQLCFAPLGTTYALLRKLSPLFSQTHPAGPSIVQQKLYSITFGVDEYARPSAHEAPMKFAHASFSDYLCDFSRSGRFFVDLPKLHCSLARRWMKLQSRHLERHERCSVLQCQAGEAPCWRIPLDGNSLPPRPHETNGLATVGFVDILWHCVEAEFTAELRRDIFYFDFRGMLKVIANEPAPGGRPGDIFWWNAIRSLELTIWLEKSLMSPAEIQHVQSEIQQGIQATSSEYARSASPRLIGLCLSNLLTWGASFFHFQAIMGESYTNLEWFSPPLTKYTTQNVQPGCELDDIRGHTTQNRIMYPRCKELISEALAPKFDLNGEVIDDSSIYCDFVLQVTRYLLKHGAGSSINVFQQYLPEILPKIPHTIETAAFIQENLLKVPENLLTRRWYGPHHDLIASSPWVDRQQLFISICIYLSECKISYIANHHHNGAFIEGEWACGICELFHGNTPVLADTELSLDPADRPEPRARWTFRDAEHPQYLPAQVVARRLHTGLAMWLQWLSALKTRMIVPIGYLIVIFLIVMHILHIKPPREG